MSEVELAMERDEEEAEPDRWLSWLADLKPGDDVFIESGRESTLRRASVERLTATLIVASGRKFRRSDGVEPGSTSRSVWDVATRLRQSDDTTVNRYRGQRDEAERRRHVRDIQDRISSKLDLDKLRRIVAILDEPVA